MVLLSVIAPSSWSEMLALLTVEEVGDHLGAGLNPVEAILLARRSRLRPGVQLAPPRPRLAVTILRSVLFIAAADIDVARFALAASTSRATPLGSLVALLLGAGLTASALAMRRPSLRSEEALAPCFVVFVLVWGLWAVTLEPLLLASLAAAPLTTSMTSVDEALAAALFLCFLFKARSLLFNLSALGVNGFVAVAGRGVRPLAR